MSNPVVFFDMEIGGQPAGTIEMTVRPRARGASARESERARDARARERAPAMRSLFRDRTHRATTDDAHASHAR